jgi:protocatechuate 3,4-dioxygenase beta subunit
MKHQSKPAHSHHDHQELEAVKSASRRQFLRRGGLVAGGLIGSGFFARAFASACGLTPPQTEGPFYPETEIVPENDLTGGGRAKGEAVMITGKVTDGSCKPVADVNVEIWQACVSGRYNHSRDPNDAQLDPNFKYWGETFTNSNGEYSFQTIIPGAYPADQNWMRPPHIHFRVAKRGYRELITQMYFEGEALNDADLILQDLSPAERERVIVAFEGGVGRFDIAIESVR